MRKKTQKFSEIKFKIFKKNPLIFPEIKVVNL